MPPPPFPNLFFLSLFSLKNSIADNNGISCVINIKLSSEEKEEKKENGNGKAKTLLGSSHTEKIGISLVDDDVGIVFKVRAMP